MSKIVTLTILVCCGYINKTFCWDNKVIFTVCRVTQPKRFLNIKQWLEFDLGWWNDLMVEVGLFQNEVEIYTNTFLSRSLWSSTPRCLFLSAPVKSRFYLVITYFKVKTFAYNTFKDVFKELLNLPARLLRGKILQKTNKMRFEEPIH